MGQPTTILFPKGDQSTPGAKQPAHRSPERGKVAARRPAHRSPERGKVAVDQVRVSRNGRGGKGKASSRSHSDEADARYTAALRLVQVIDHNLQKGTRHYYDTQGRLLNTLDEVIHAMLADTLALGKPDEHLQGDEAVEWAPVREMVA